jgi:hypothetical protein
VIMHLAFDSRSHRGGVWLTALSRGMISLHVAEAAGSHDTAV